MTEIVNLVVTCTKRKTAKIPDTLRMRVVRGESCQDRVRDWQDRLRSSEVDSVPVRHLYAGDHWNVARELHGLERMAFNVHVWVASAGCGLVSMNESLKPYSATFSSRHPDSVVTANVSAADWWRAVSTGRGKRSIHHLAKESPDALLLIAASTTYLEAMQADLATARRTLRDPNLLAIISAGTRTLGDLDDHLLPCDARMKHCVGGVLRSLNVRIARKLLRETRGARLTLATLRQRLTRLSGELPPLVKYDRAPMSDDEVLDYISSALDADPMATRTPLLRRLRDSGFACEQGRFRDLFKAAKTR